MPFTPFSFDDSVARTDPGRARVPEGFYLIECEGLEPTAQDYEKTTGVYNKIRIVQGPDAQPGLGVGGRLRDYNALGTAKAQFGLGMTLGAYGQADLAHKLAGQQIPSYQVFSQLTARLSQMCTGKRAVAHIADQPGQSRPFSGVVALYPESDWVNYKGNAPMGPSTAPQPRNGPTPGSPSVLDGASELFADLDTSV